MNGDVGIDHLGHLTERIIGCVIKVHRTLGPGFHETVYRRALIIEFRKHRLPAVVEQRVVIYYDGQVVGRHRLDLVVEGRVLLELKTVDALAKAHYSQVRSNLKATQLPLALLINFASPKADFRRIPNPFR